MTGDAVNDAAAIKQADIGVAMGSGCEVTKQAARLVLTDDNFSTLVHAVELGRSIYQKITAYIRFQMSQLIGLVLLFLRGEHLRHRGRRRDDADDGAVPELLRLRVPRSSRSCSTRSRRGSWTGSPRDPNLGISNGKAVRRWILYGSVLCISSGLPLVLGPDTPSPDHATASMTMAFVVMGLGSVLSGLVLRREPESGLAAPLLTAVKVLSAPAILVVLATELDFLQGWLTTQSLTGRPVARDAWASRWRCRSSRELDKVIMRRRLAKPAVLAPQEVVVPARARV